MIGAIIGDIAGSRFEFNNARSEKFKLFTATCDFTDDTVCTVAIADAVMHGRPFDVALRDWCGRYPTPRGSYGAAFAVWLHTPGAGPYWSFGNGAAMRVSPIAYLAGSPDRVMSLALKSAIVTHDHPEGIKGAQVTAGAGFLLREIIGRGGSIEEAKSDFKTWVEIEYGKLPEYRPFSNHFNETCMNAVPVAASCLLASMSFDDAIRKAILVGGDSDTIAAIVGGWAEALYGVPAGLVWMARQYLPKDILGVVDEFNKRVYGA